MTSGDTGTCRDDEYQVDRSEVSSITRWSVYGTQVEFLELFSDPPGLASEVEPGSGSRSRHDGHSRCSEADIVHVAEAGAPGYVVALARARRRSRRR